jgi:hypothetical protein
LGMVKYVAAMGERYSSNSLLDMRIHDITVVADPNKHAPAGSDPVGADGTAERFIPCTAAIALMDGFSGILDANTISWWTGWWPLLHMRTSGNPNPDSFYSFESTIDLLGSISIENFELETSKDDQLTDFQMESLAAQGIDDFMTDAFPVDAVLILTAFIAYSIIQYCLATMIVVPSPASLVALTLLVTVFGLAVWTALLSITDGVLSGRFTPGTAVALVLLGIIPMLAVGCVLDRILYIRFFAKYWQMRNLGWGYRGIGLILLSFYLCAVQFFLLSLALILLVVLLCMSIDYYHIFAT